MATSFFRDEADMRARMVLIDGFNTHDTNRLQECLGEQYVAFSKDELSQLADVQGVLISKEWFMDYDYALDTVSGEKMTEFYNPTTLENNHFLHAWRVFSTSPFENGAVFTSTAGSVTRVTVSPAEASVSAGQTLQLSADVVTTGFVNQAVTWSVTRAPGESESNPVTVDLNGKVTIPSDYTPTTPDDGTNTLQITATSVYDTAKTAVADITVL